MHLEIIGRSRYGKSTFLEHQILNAPEGFVFLDPHGHSAERIADTIRCIYWDASETGIGFNPLHVPKGQHHLAAAQVVYANYRVSWPKRRTQCGTHGADDEKSTKMLKKRRVKKLQMTPMNR
jgi:hypothetical protein